MADGLESLEQYRKYLNASDATALAERTAPAVREEAAYSAGMYLAGLESLSRLLRS